MIDRTPKVFISYSWTSEEYRSQVIEIATQLRNNGVDVVLDAWDLKPGQDMYAFMEQCVTNPEIDRVLVFCDKAYAEKANQRKGGVGNETAVITPEVYGNETQEKFIPVIMERDVQGNAYLPAYLGSRLYVDLTDDNYEKGYEELLRIIYEQPEKRKPELGKCPVWLTEDESSGLFPLKSTVKRINTLSLAHQVNMDAKGFIEDYIEAIKIFFKSSYKNNQEYLDDFERMKDYRDVFLDFVKAVSSQPDFGNRMADIFENLFNSLYCLDTFGKNDGSYRDSDFDIFQVHIWELFICTVAFMLQYEMYSDINELLQHSYFLKISHIGTEKQENSYQRFNYYSEMLEEVIKPTLDGNDKNLYTLAGHIIYNKREYKPVFSGSNIANADLFLYQIFNGLELDGLYCWRTWYPMLYIYTDGNRDFWKRLKSRRFCKKIMPIFGVNTLDKLVEKIRKCKHERNFMYSRGRSTAKDILNCLEVNEIATLP